VPVSRGWAPGLNGDETIAFLFPGTGSGGMPDLRTLTGFTPAAPRIIGDVLAEVQESLLGAEWPSLRSILWEKPGGYPAVACLPGVAQIASYTTSVAVDRILRVSGIRPDFAVGQSIGEIPALVCAGVFSVGDGAQMVVNAVSVLTRHGAGGGMGLLTAGEEQTHRCIERAGTSEVMVACLNTPSVTVVSGPDGPLGDVLKVAQDSGIRAVRLAVPYLSHHPAVAGAGAEYYEMIRRFRQRSLKLPVYSGVWGRAYRDDDDLHRALADCMVRPIRLSDALRAVHRAGATVFVEAGTGNALCQCASLTVPDVSTMAPLGDQSRDESPE
jgi:acyl transferase domain-containing protein